MQKTDDAKRGGKVSLTLTTNDAFDGTRIDAR